MTCAACSARIERTLGKMEGIEKIHVNLATETATLSFNPSVVTPETIKEKVTKMGYDIDITPADERQTSKPTTDAREQVDHSLKRDFLTALLLTIPVSIINMGMMWNEFVLFTGLSLDQLNRVLLILSTPIMFLPARRFFTVFLKNLRSFSFEMNSLVAIGTGAAFGYSALVTLFPEISVQHHGVHTYYDTAAMIVTLILMGKVLEARAKKKTVDSIKELMALKPKTAFVRKGEAYIEVALDTIIPGDMVLVKPGGIVPADGTIISGSTLIDESVMTGESLPAEKNPGDRVIGGCINKDGSIEIKVTATGANTLLGGIIRSVQEAQGTKAPIQKLADKISGIFVPVVMGIAAVTVVVWMIADGSIQNAMIHSVAVLIIACPCALGLATPTALIAGLGNAARKGILIKNGEVLERAEKVTHVVLDKTGTVTEGKIAVAETSIQDTEALGMIYEVCSRSSHPYSQALAVFCNPYIQNSEERVQVENVSGKGMKGVINGVSVLIGSVRFLSEEQVALPNDMPSESIVLAALDGLFSGYFILRDYPKQSAAKTVAGLKELGYTTILLSGDRNAAVERIRTELQFDQAFGEVLPEEKGYVISRLQKEGAVVAMAGDGINDAPALAKADVGISFTSGTDVAAETAGITLIRDDLGEIIRALRLSKRVMKIIRQNLFWAFVYNSIGIPLAAFGIMNPMVAALAMSLSSVSVVTNSLRLRKD